MDSERYEATLLQFYEDAIHNLGLEKYLSALSSFQNCKLIIDTQHLNLNPLIVLSILHNISVCYHKLQKLKKCAHFIALSIEKAREIEALNSSNRFSVMLVRYKIHRNLQICAVLSCEKNHTLALRNAKIALKHTYKLFEELFDNCRINSYHQKDQKAEKAIKIREIIRRVIMNNFEKTDIIFTQKWVNDYNLCNITSIRPFCIQEWVKDSKEFNILSMNFIIHSVFILIGCYFTIATESRLLEKASEADSSISKSKEWYQKSLEIASCFLPNTCPLLIHISNFFQKYHKKHLPISTTRRIFLQRNSEKPRDSSEKSFTRINTTFGNIPPTRKLTPSSRNTSSRLRAANPYNSRKVFIPQAHEKITKDKKLKIINQGASLLKDYLKLRNDKVEINNLSSDESIDCNSHTAQDFKNNFVMTSKLLYGEREDGDEEHERISKKSHQRSSKVIKSKIKLLRD